MVSINAPRKVWTKAAYYHLSDSPALAGERVELVGGELIVMSPQRYAHAWVVATLNMLLTELYGKTHVVRVQLPLDLGNLSQPEPDFAVVSLELHRTSRPHPKRADLVIEVADTSLAYDREEKASLYASAGIPEYWLVNLVNRQLEVFTDPAPDSLAPFEARYRRLTTLQQGLVEAQFAPGSLRVEEFFPEVEA